MENKYTCPVCGYDELVEPPYDSDGFGTYEICVCCGFEFGADDFPDKEKGFKTGRKKWIEDGCKWFSKTTKQPKKWNGLEQVQGFEAEREQ